MKKALILMTLAAVLVSCDRQAARKVFHLTGGTDLEISYEGGNVYFGIEANEDDHWTVSTDADWFSIRQTFGNGDGAKGYDDAVIQVRADRWTRNSTRTGNVTVTGPTGTFRQKRKAALPRRSAQLLLRLNVFIAAQDHHRLVIRRSAELPQVTGGRIADQLDGERVAAVQMQGPAGIFVREIVMPRIGDG